MLQARLGKLLIVNCTVLDGIGVQAPPFGVSGLGWTGEGVWDGWKLDVYMYEYIYLVGYIL